MKIVIPGGSGQVGRILARAFRRDGHEVVILSRTPDESWYRTIYWDAASLGEWKTEFENADVVINLAGKNVNCRYTPENRKMIMDSRIRSTRVVGKAIAAASDPPRVWLQSSTATIYSHRHDAPNDEKNGIIGGDEPDAPEKWRFSVDVARAWERAAENVSAPRTRLVLMRSAVILSPDKGSIFDILLTLVRRRLGGTAGNGKQYVSWIHEDDFVNAVYFLIEKETLAGAVNIASPYPIQNSEFMRILRKAGGAGIGIPAPEWLLPIGAFFMRTETELILKSRRVVPGRLSGSGFEFKFPHWRNAAPDLCEGWRQARLENKSRTG